MHPETLLCALGRVEHDEYATSYADGVLVDPYGDECGEYLFRQEWRGGLEAR